MTWRSMLMATAVAHANPALAESTPDSAEVTDVDASAIRDLVRRQLSAFRNGRARDAWELCSASIRETFEDPAELLQTIETNYPALVGTRQLVFGDFVITPDGLAVLVHVVGPDDVPREALYLVQQDLLGAWRVHGCMMHRQRAEAQALAA